VIFLLTSLTTEAEVAMPNKGLRKFRFERQLGRTVMNPMVAAFERVGVRPSLVVELETTGRKSGEPRRVPLAGGADDRGVWVISQHGRRAGWAHNISANPTVRVRVNGQWRSGTATFEPDDDIRARARSFGGESKLIQSATALTMRAMESDPISVRITYDQAQQWRRAHPDRRNRSTRARMRCGRQLPRILQRPRRRAAQEPSG